jgi:hypothetical protein
MIKSYLILMAARLVAVFWPCSQRVSQHAPQAGVRSCGAACCHAQRPSCCWCRPWRCLPPKPCSAGSGVLRHQLQVPLAPSVPLLKRLSRDYVVCDGVVALVQRLSSRRRSLQSSLVLHR